MLRIEVRKTSQSSPPNAGGAKAFAYYSMGGKASGRWHGRASEWLAVEGTVANDDFIALWENRDPAIGQRLTMRMKSNRRIAYDFNFNAPKSISVYHAISRDPRMERLIREAAHSAMLHVELAIETRVRRDGFDTNRPTGNLVWTDFFHDDARPVDGRSDPHAHVHCLAFNVTYDDVEQEWKAAQFNAIKRDGRYYEAIFHNHLSAGLEREGFRLRRDGDKYELADIPESTLEKFSRRTKVIESFAEQKGITSPKVKATLGARTREDKVNGPSEPAAEWSARLTPEEAVAIRNVEAEAKPQPRAPSDPALIAKALAYAREYSFERMSVVSEKQLLDVALRFAIGQIDPGDLAKAFAADTSVLRSVVDGYVMVTTPHVLAEEERVVQWVRHSQGVMPPLAPASAIDHTLDAEIQAAMRHVLSSRDRVTGIHGRSGAGKTTLMKSLIPAIEAEGHRVTVLAPGAAAGRGTLRAAGFAEANTVARLLMSPTAQDAARGGVWWVDEAGLLSMKDMARLVDLADKLEARLILSGDTSQHRAVERGDALRTIIKHADLKMATLSKVRRQTGTYREAVEHWAENRLTEAFERLDAMGAFVEISTKERHQRLADEYLQSVVAGEKALVISPTHSECRKVTELIRARLKGANRLTDERLFVVLRRVDMHLADKRRSDYYQVGQIFEMDMDADCHAHGKRYPVAKIEDGEVYLQHERGAIRRLNIQEHAERFHVYTAHTLPIAIGEQIRITRNGRSVSHRRELNNQDIHTVEGFTESGDLVTTEGTIIDQDYAHITHGYASTSYSAQSKTVDQVFVAESSESFRAASREQFYVSISRGQVHVRIFTDDKEALFEAVKESSRRLAAMDGGFASSQTVKKRKDLIDLTAVSPRRLHIQLGSHYVLPKDIQTIHTTSDREIDNDDKSGASITYDAL